MVALIYIFLNKKKISLAETNSRNYFSGRKTNKILLYRYCTVLTKPFIQKRFFYTGKRIRMRTKRLGTKSELPLLAARSCTFNKSLKSQYHRLLQRLGCSVSDPHWLYADPNPVRIRILVKFESSFLKVNKKNFFSSNFSHI
jgi:hypothetical protein